MTHTESHTQYLSIRISSIHASECFGSDCLSLVSRVTAVEMVKLGRRLGNAAPIEHDLNRISAGISTGRFSEFLYVTLQGYPRLQTVRL